MRVKFRGILQREALLLNGPLGWANSAPSPSTATRKRPAGSPPRSRPAGRAFPSRCAPASPSTPRSPPSPRTGSRRSWPDSAGWTPSKLRWPSPGRAWKTTPRGLPPSAGTPGRSDPGGRERGLGRACRRRGADPARRRRAGIRRTARAVHRRARGGAAPAAGRRDPRADRCGRKRAQGIRPAPGGACRRCRSDRG